MAAEAVGSDAYHPMFIQWVQGDQPFKFLVLVRRATDREVAESEAAPPPCDGSPDDGRTTMAAIVKGRTE